MDARRLDDLVAYSLFSTATTGGSTASGSWVDIENFEGDMVLLVNVTGVTGSGTITVQPQLSAANTGASPSSASDTRGSSLAITAVGIYLLPLAVSQQPAQSGQSANYLGVDVTYSGFTGSVQECILLARAKAWTSGASD
jgi:hypothetical protein